jgi:hypothetical protein
MQALKLQLARKPHDLQLPDRWLCIVARVQHKRSETNSMMLSLRDNKKGHRQAHGRHPKVGRCV